MSGRFVHFLHLSDEDKTLILEALLVASAQIRRDAREISMNPDETEAFYAKANAMQALYDRARGASAPRRHDVRAGREG